MKKIVMDYKQLLEQERIIRSFLFSSTGDELTRLQLELKQVRDRIDSIRSDRRVEVSFNFGGMS